MTGTRDDFAAIVREIGEQLDQHVTLADLSRRTGCSPFHFHRSFTATAGPPQRLDACIPLLVQVHDQGRFTVREFPGGRYAGVEHVRQRDTIIQAYRHVADWIRRSKTLTFSEGAPVQIFRHVDRDPDQRRTEVHLPVVRRTSSSKNRLAPP